MASPEQMFDRRFITPIQQIVEKAEERAARKCSYEDCDEPGARLFQGEPFCTDHFHAMREDWRDRPEFRSR